MASIFTRRIVAYILDFFVVSAFMWILAFICSALVAPVNSYGVYKHFPYVLPILILVYFVFCEKVKGATVGKSLMYLQVRSRNGAKINWAQSIVRNLTKIYWVPIIFDWAIGKFFGGDRLFSEFTKTTVVNELG